MDRIETMKAFITVAKLGSFTKAAEKLDTSNQLISKYVSDLESHLGVRLFNRTTRSVRLTEAGEQSVHHIRHILESIQDMEGGLGLLKDEARGTLRINAPVSFSIKQLSPLVCAFRKLHPAVKINLQLNDRQVDVIEEGFDLALRIGHLKSSSLIAKRLAPIRLVLVASPSYLEKYGTATHPEQLIPNHFLHYSYMSNSRDQGLLWQTLKRFTTHQESEIACNNGDILIEAAIAGEGYALQPAFLAGDAIKQGRLKILLKEFEPEPMGLYALYPHRKLMATKLSTFINFISTYYGDNPSWGHF